MPIVRTVHETDKVKVAAIFDLGEIRPAWFQVSGKKPVRITQLSAVWYCNARVINFEIGDGCGRYCLTYDTLALAWSLGRTIIE
jgi:hypothetical protein